MAPFYYLLAFCVLEGYIVIISFDLSEMGTSGYFIKKIISYKKWCRNIYSCLRHNVFDSFFPPRVKIPQF